MRNGNLVLRCKTNNRLARYHTAIFGDELNNRFVVNNQLCKYIAE